MPDQNKRLKKSPHRLFAAALLGLLVSFTAHAADIAGQWRGEVETPGGTMKCTYIFRVESEKLTGRVTAEFGGQKLEGPLQELKLDGDKLTFFETVEIQGNSIRIYSTGKVGADEIVFARKIGDFANDELVARRVKDKAAPPAAKPPATNAAIPDKK